MDRAQTAYYSTAVFQQDGGASDQQAPAIDSDADAHGLHHGSVHGTTWQK
jgi:hypothetical protein